MSYVSPAKTWLDASCPRTWRSQVPRKAASEPVFSGFGGSLDTDHSGSERWRLGSTGTGVQSGATPALSRRC